MQVANRNRLTNEILSRFHLLHKYFVFSQATIEHGTMNWTFLSTKCHRTLFIVGWFWALNENLCRGFTFTLLSSFNMDLLWLVEFVFHFRSFLSPCPYHLRFYHSPSHVMRNNLEVEDLYVAAVGICVFAKFWKYDFSQIFGLVMVNSCIFENHFSCFADLFTKVSSNVYSDPSQ